MKKILLVAFLAVSSTVALAADLGVSVNIGQPGFYGQIDIGGYPPPQVIYQQPRAVYRVPVDRPPVYLRVPPGHSKNWRKYCGRYNACDERVYFVQNNWYQRQYAPQYRQNNFDGRHSRPDDHRNDRRDDYRHDRRDEHDNGQRGNDRGYNGRQ